MGRKFKKQSNKGLQPLFAFASFIHKRNLNRLLGRSKTFIRILGIILGKFYIAKTPHTPEQVKGGIKLLWPQFSERKVEKLFRLLI